MKNDEIYKILKNQAELKCGSIWKDMNEKEQITAMLKVAITMLKAEYGA